MPSCSITEIAAGWIQARFLAEPIGKMGGGRFLTARGNDPGHHPLVEPHSEVLDVWLLEVHGRGRGGPYPQTRKIHTVIKMRL